MNASAIKTCIQLLADSVDNQLSHRSTSTSKQSDRMAGRINTFGSVQNSHKVSALRPRMFIAGCQLHFVLSTVNSLYIVT